LKQRAAKIAACALLAKLTKAGGRHESAIVVTGFLCRCGFSVPVIKTFIEALAGGNHPPFRAPKGAEMQAARPWAHGLREAEVQRDPLRGTRTMLAPIPR
jgi:hypothetical protein